MKTKSIFIAAIALLALILSACGPTTINQAAPVPVRTLNVAGMGQAILTPDIAYIYVGVHTEKPSATEAVSENTAQTQTVIDALKKFGIAEKDIRTTNFSIYPNDKYDPQTGQPTGQKVYAVDNTVYVTVRKIDTLGDLLDTLVSAGANTINSVQFDVADKSTALKQARTDAMKDAEKQAKELAGAANVTLGDIQSINFYDNTPIPFAAGKGGGAAVADAAAVPIQTGQLTFTVTVNVTYAIK
jgi:uncharacterized protein